MTTNQKGRKLFLTTNSDWVRYRDGKWIESRKRIYLYWFKFLRHAEESSEHKVQWNKYRAWGGKDAVMNMRFDDWWEEHGENLIEDKWGELGNSGPYEIDPTPQHLYDDTGGEPPISAEERNRNSLDSKKESHGHRYS